MSVISPKHWRTFIFPHIKEVCTELYHYHPEVKIYCHICGNILPIAEDLVETGLDCIGPLDPLGHFTPGEVRKRVGDAVSLMGGVNTLSFIDSTPEEIIEEARGCIIQAGEKGGYILGSGCVVPRDAKRENVEALRIASERYGIYRDGRLCISQEHKGLG
jgi:uroporphyrinogen-III decarboxylase